ncbi:hypothetical protein MMPV_009203 [Pyropia vietnamensis]
MAVPPAPAGSGGSSTEADAPLASGGGGGGAPAAASSGDGGGASGSGGGGGASGFARRVPGPAFGGGKGGGGEASPYWRTSLGPSALVELLDQLEGAAAVGGSLQSSPAGAPSRASGAAAAAGRRSPPPGSPSDGSNPSTAGAGLMEPLAAHVDAASTADAGDEADGGLPTLGDFLDEDDLVSEARSGNERLLAYLTADANLQELLTLCIEPSGSALAAVLSGDADQAKAAHHSAKRQYAAAEVLTASVPQLLDALVCGRPPPLERLWDALRHTPAGQLDTFAAGRITRVLSSVLASRGEELLHYLCIANGPAASEAAAPGGALSALVSHVALPVVADLFVRLLDAPDEPEGEPDPSCGSGLVRSSDEEPSAAVPSASSEVPRPAALQLLADCDVVVALIASSVSQLPLPSAAGSGADQLLREETVTACLTTVVAMTRRLLYLHTVGVAVPAAIFVHAGGPATDALGRALDVALTAEADGQALLLRQLLVALKELMDAAMPPPSTDGDGGEGGFGGPGGGGGASIGGARVGGGGGVMGGRSRPLPRFAAAGRQGYGNRFRAPTRGRPGVGVGRPAGASGTGAALQTQPVSPASAMAVADADSVPEVVDQVVDDIDDDAVANACASTPSTAENRDGKAGAPAVEAAPPTPVDPVVPLAPLEGVIMARLPTLLSLLTHRLDRARTSTIPVPTGAAGLALTPPTPSADTALGLTGLRVAELLATMLARGSADGVGSLSKHGVPATLLSTITAYPWTSMLHAAVSGCIKAALAADAHPYRVRAWREAGLLSWLNEVWTAGNVADGCAAGSRGEPPRARGDGGDGTTGEGNSQQRRSSADSSSPTASTVTPPNNDVSDASSEAREVRRQREGGVGGVSRLRPAYMGHLVSVAVDVGAWLDRLQPPSASGSGATNADVVPSDSEVSAIRALLAGAVGEAVTAQERPLGERPGTTDGGAAGAPLDGRQVEDEEDAVEEVVEVIYDYNAGEGDDASDVSDVMDVQAEVDGAVTRGRSSSRSSAAGDARGRSLSAAFTEALPDKTDRKKASVSDGSVAGSRGGGRGSGRRAGPSVASPSAAITELADDDEDIQTVDVEDVVPSASGSRKTPSPPPALPSAPAAAPHMNGNVSGAPRVTGTASGVAPVVRGVAAMDLSSSDDEDEYVKFDPDADDFVDADGDDGYDALVGDPAGASAPGGSKTPASASLALLAGAAPPPPTRVGDFVAADGGCSSSDDDGEWEPFDPNDDDDEEEDDDGGDGAGNAMEGASSAVTGGSGGSATPPP